MKRKISVTHYKELVHAIKAANYLLNFYANQCDYKKATKVNETLYELVHELKHSMVDETL